MTAEELENLITDNRAPVLLDVRSGLEYRSGHIPGAVHAPLSSVQGALEALSVTKKDLLLLVCEHGPRAQLVKFFLKMRGYSRVELLQGHMAHWRGSGRFMQAGS